MVLVLVLPFIAFAINACAFRWVYPQLIPEEFSLRAWQYLIKPNSKVGVALLNSLLIATSVTGIAVIIGMPAARAIGLYQFPGKRLVELIILLPIMIPPLVVSMGLSINFIRWGLAGTRFGVILVHLVPVIPYVVFTLAGVFANYNIDYEEQARSLGAPQWVVMRDIMFPAVLPGVAVASLFAFLISWSQYILTFLTGQGKIITLPILLFASVPGGNNANIAALSLVFITPTLFVLLLTSRYLSQNISVVYVR